MHGVEDAIRVVGNGLARVLPHVLQQLVTGALDVVLVPVISGDINASINIIKSIYFKIDMLINQ